MQREGGEREKRKRDKYNQRVGKRENERKKERKNFKVKRKMFDCTKFEVKVEPTTYHRRNLTKE